jgi:carboxymethylenebutenolidase
MYGPNGDRLEKLLTELGVDHDVKTYPDAGHSFTPAYSPRSAG